ncbi:MAG TPA: carbon storage regulator [Pirellulaceae bacterium]|nr:carbon storage regulator [Pirellulaceae bacterium]
MLVLSRKIGEKLVIGEGITVVVNRIAGNRVTLGIEAPRDVRIVRAELRPMELEFAGVSDPHPQAALAGEFGGDQEVASDSFLRLAK